MGAGGMGPICPKPHLSHLPKARKQVENLGKGGPIFPNPICPICPKGFPFQKLGLQVSGGKMGGIGVSGVSRKPETPKEDLWATCTA